MLNGDLVQQQVQIRSAQWGDRMASPFMRPLETALIELLQHLGIGRAHFAAGQLVPTDWVGLAARYPERIASLTLVSPRVRRPELESVGPSWYAI